MVIGALATIRLPETKNKTLEEIADDGKPSADDGKPSADINIP